MDSQSHPLPLGITLERRKTLIRVYIRAIKFGTVKRMPSGSYRAQSLAMQETETFYTLRAAILFAAQPVMPLNPHYRMEILGQ